MAADAAFALHVCCWSLAEVFRGEVQHAVRTSTQFESAAVAIVAVIGVAGLFDCFRWVQA